MMFTKTGFINESGKCLTACCCINGTQFVIVALNSSINDEEIKYEMKFLLDNTNGMVV
ncbi:MAG: hypothetical protein PHC75_05415 [Burkholderiales bacterium]|nr:hypothetical protein [Burkholderiales bacterium]